ncbi:MAG: MATE family efflux transporter [Isosphaeraceae bacterium]
MVEAAAHEIGSRTLRRQVVSLAIPVLIEQTLLYFVGLSDTLITGRYLAEDHLAAVTVAGYLLWFLSSLLTVVSVGATALVARMFGANERPVAVRITQQALLMAMILGTLIAVGGIALAPGIVWALNLRGEPAQLAVVFLRIVLSVTPLLACTTAGVACLRGAGDTRTGGWVMVLVNILNVTFTWTLVRGWGPIPAYGFPGVAAGTAVAEGIGGIIVLVVLARGRSGLVFNVRDPRPSWPEIRRILRISLPATGESLTNVLCQLWFLGLINRLGPVATGCTAWRSAARPSPS